MGVTFDPSKNQLNLRKHAVSLQRAEDFDITTALVKLDDSQDYGERRYLAIGWLDALLYMLTFTVEGDGMRAISLRRATKQEHKLYAEEN